MQLHLKQDWAKTIVYWVLIPHCLHLDKQHLSDTQMIEK